MTALRFVVMMSMLALPSVAQDARPLDNFPAPAPEAHTVVGAALGNGLLLLWNGNVLYQQTALDTDAYEVVAEGYAGDPAFVAVAPDGHSVVLGAGLSEDLYSFDSDAPADYSPESVLASQRHFAGTFLDQDLLLIDGPNSISTRSELSIVDLSSEKSAPRPVVSKPFDPALKELIINKPPSSYSAGLAVDPVNDVVYSMDANTRELRHFSRSAVIAKYEEESVLDWVTDGTVVGIENRYFTGGVSGITPDGLLVIGGSEGFGDPGGIQLVQPDTGDITDTLDPAGNGPFYTAIYNPATAVLVARDDADAWAIPLDSGVSEYAAFPEPAEGAYTVVGTSLPWGRLLLWNGGAVYRQVAPRVDLFEVIAEGYAGDPGFMDLSPDGSKVILGAGYGGDLMILNPAAPEDFTETALVANQSHFGGAFVADELLLLDIGKADSNGTALVILDITAEKSLPVVVIAKPAKADDGVLVIDKPPSSYSATLAVDFPSDRVYAMDANTRELRRFSLAAILAVYATASTLDWTEDGIAVGVSEALYTGGVVGITREGLLVVGGSEGFGLPGGIQFVHPDSGDVVETFNVEDDQGFYSLIYGAESGVLTTRIDTGVFAADLLQQDLPTGAEGEGEGEGEGSSEGEGEGEGEGDDEPCFLESARLLIVTVLTALGILTAMEGGFEDPCFIATAAYGTPMATEIDVLRIFRDAYLLDSGLGAAFVDCYYRLSPPLADWVAQSPLLAACVRVVLAPVLVAARLLMAVPHSALIFFGLAVLPLRSRRRRAASLR